MGGYKIIILAQLELPELGIVPDYGGAGPRSEGTRADGVEGKVS